MVQFHALGALTITDNGDELSIGGPRQRRLVAMLLIHRNTVVSVDRLADAVFAGEPTPAANTTLRSYVARMRRVVDDVASGPSIMTQAPGYMLRLPGGDFDVARFEELVTDGRARLELADGAAAASVFRQAVDLWRGDAYAEFADEDWARPEAQRLEELRLVAQERLIDAELSCGRAGEVLPRIESLANEHPLRESFRAQLVTALYRTGRQVEALRVVRDFRRELADEVGLDPSPSLTELERLVLTHDTSLMVSEPAGLPLRGYRLGERLGTGHDGTVHAARLPGIDRDFAIRIIRDEIADDPEFVLSFEATTRRIASFGHQAVVAIHDFWREPGAAYVVMRRMSGGTLRDRLHRGSMSTADVAVLAERVGGALAAAAEAGIVHGRVSPDNVLFDAAGEPFLTDFALGPAAARRTPSEDVHDFAVMIAESLAGSVAGDGRAATLADAASDVLGRATSTAGRPSMAEFVPALVASLTGSRHGADAVVVNPYKGLLAFDEADAADFFGRDALIDDILVRLAGDGLRGRLVLVVGGSGTGKSSSVRAGLIPRVRAGGVAGSARWFVTTTLPGGSPFKELAESLRRIAVGNSTGLAEDLAGDAQGIDRVLRRLVPSDGQLLLVIDQFEELFTLATEQDQRAFLDGLMYAVTATDSRLHVVATLRADFYDRPLAFQPFGSAVNDATVTIAAMLPADLEAAIVEPAQRVGRSVERALAAELVGALADEPAALPALQFTLYELAERSSDGPLTLAAYRELGGMGGAIASRAELLYSSLDDDERLAVRRMFERLVVVSADGEPTRRRAPRSELLGDVATGSADAVIDRWAQARLLMLDRHPHTRVPTVELAHEALLREWPRLRQWIDEDRGALIVLSRLRDAAANWDEVGRDTGALYRGTPLAVALDVIAGRLADVPAVEREFVEASRIERDREQQQEKELIARQARTNRRLRFQLAAIAVALVVALAGGLVALNQRREADQERRVADQQRRVADEERRVADEERRVATARELSAAADANLVDDPERSMLLSLAAIDETRSHGEAVRPEAVESLHRAVTSSRLVLSVPGVGGALDWSADGVFVTEGVEESGVVDIRDDSTGRSVMSFHGHDVDVNDVGFSADGSRLISSGDDGSARVWDPTTGKKLFEVGGASEGQVWGPSLSADGSLMSASWLDEGRVRVMDVDTGATLLDIEAPQINETSLSPDGTRLVLGVWTDAKSRVLDIATGKVVFDLEGGPQGVRDAMWSPDGRWIATAAGSARIYDSKTGKQRFAFAGRSGSVSGLDWSPDSSRVAVASDDGTASVLAISDDGVNELLSVSARDMRNGVRGVAFSADGNRIMTGDWAVTSVKIWDVTDTAAAEVANVVNAGAYTANSAAFTPDGRGVFGRADGGMVTLTDVATGKRMATYRPPRGVGSGDIDRFEVSPDGRLLAANGGDQQVTVWEVSTERHVFTVEPDVSTDAYVRDLTWSPDSSVLAIATIAGTQSRVEIVDRSGAPISTLRDEQSLALVSVSFNPAGNLLATTRASQRDDPTILGVSIWDWRRGNIVRTFATKSHYAAFDPTGTRIATRRQVEGIAEIWDAATGEKTATLTGHTGIITDIVFSQDGTRVATSSVDGTVRLWDAETGAQQFVLRARPTSVAAVAFSPDGARLASVGGDGILHVWALDLDELIAIAEDRLTRALSDDECRQYLHLESCPTP